MGWFDNLWRRRQGNDSTETERDTAEARASVREARRPETETDRADELEERAHQNRDDEIFREPRIPPGTC